MEASELLRELTEARGPSGYETEVRELVREKLSAVSDEVRTDTFGNVVALKRGEAPGGGAQPDHPAEGRGTPAEGQARPSLMLAAHMDEIALMVCGLEKGFLRITQIGGFDPRVLFGQKVTVHAKRDLPGLIVSIPPHFTAAAEREKPVPLEKLFVDVGLPPPEVEGLVAVGDVITLRARYAALAGGYAFSKSMDDRASVAALILCMEELSGRRHSWDVFAVGTVQEEATGAGAITGAYQLEPAIGIAVDVTFGQQAGLSGPEAVKVDGGPCLAIGPNIHPRIFERLAEAARAIELPYQVEPVPGSTGTDAWAIQVSRSGIPTGLVSIPLRYMHTPVETVALRDVERAARLLAEFVCRLDLSFAGSLATADALVAGDPSAEKEARAGGPPPGGERV